VFLSVSVVFVAMSFLDSVKTKAAAAARAVVDTTKAVVSDLQAYPSQVMCSQCKEKMTVPPAIFVWQCENKHDNDRGASECKECKQVRPKDLPAPKVHCDKCNIDTVVPTSNAMRYVKEGGENVKNLGKQAYTQTKDSVAFLQSTPTTFQ
jgi:hypothetical protein